MKNLEIRKKNQIYIFFGIFIFITIILSNFLKMHYAQDTYCTMTNGYSYTAKNAFLYSGRPISATVFYIADFLNLSMSTHVFIMTCLAIVNLSLTVYVLFTTVDKLLNKKDDGKTICLILFVTFFSIFNFCTMDLLVFSESGILTMGLLFSVLAGCEWTNDKKGKYLKIILFSFIGVLCYQGILNIYVPIALIFIVSKNKENVKRAFIQAFVALLFYGIALVLSMLVSKFISSAFMINSRATIVPTIPHIFSTYLKYIKFLVGSTLNMGPKYWYIGLITIISIIYFIIVIKNKYPKIFIFYYIAIWLSAILLPILPLIVQSEDKQYLEPRMCVSFGASIGLMIIYILLTIKMDESNILLSNILKALIIVIFIMNCQYVIQSSGEMIATNLLDRNIADSIINKMEIYEKENNVEIKNIGIDYDTNLEFYYNGSGIYRCLNLKSLATDWAIAPILEIYGNRELNGVEVPEQIHNKYFKGKNWNCFDEEQLVFEGDTLYICIY